MSFFVFSTIFFSLAILGFHLFLGLWTYHDAKARTENPAMWTLIVLFVPNFIGLIIYLVAGRDKTKQGSGKFKKAMITFLVLFIVSTGLFIGGTIRFAYLVEGGSWNSSSAGVQFGASETSTPSRWRLSFRSSNRDRTRTATLSAEQLRNFHATGNAEEGTVFLRITQGATTKTWDISNDFDEILDLSDFSPGRTRLEIFNENARHVRVSLDWRV
ncbi:MAG: PLD nuclease N-terminal domain-containing protein [Defluviitaleaceae bacterium]|nr:PLD nuclease N-terminal domain-containing protein [Defluviitaleaceae bacterium]